MYSEQMMREHGFDDDARFRLILHTDAIWRACRIILDVRMHRGEVTIDEAARLPRRAHRVRGAERPRRGPVVHVPPDLPDVLPAGRCCILGLRDDEQRRLGDRFSLKAFHDTLLRNGSLPISFHRRLLADGPGA